MNLHLVMLIVFISAPYCECQNATKAKDLMYSGGLLPTASNNSLTTTNQVNSGSVAIPAGLVSSLQTIIAGLITERRQPVANNKFQTTERRQPVANNNFQTTERPQPVAHNNFQTTERRQPVANNNFQTTERRQPVANHFQRVQNYVTIDNNNQLCAFEEHNFRSKFGLGRKLKNEIVGTLNTFRKEAKGGNMKCLLWSEKLASNASIKAKSCTYDNTNKDSIMALVYEKDVYVGDRLVERAVRRWREDRSRFSYGLDCRDTGSCQYQQIVWANSKEVGCAVERCIDMTYLLCLFDPPGNIRNELPYLTGDLCSQCSAPQGSTPRCNNDKLCEWYLPRPTFTV